MSSHVKSLAVCLGRDISNSVIGIEQDVSDFWKRCFLLRVFASITALRPEAQRILRRKELLSLAESRFRMHPTPKLWSAPAQGL